MATVAQSPTAAPARTPRAYHATLFDQHGRVIRVDGEYVFLADDASITVFDLAMSPWLMLHGQLGVAECQHLLGQLRGSTAAGVERSAA